VRGTNSLGTANASGGAGGGGGRPSGKRTTNNDNSTDAAISNENKKVDREIGSICRGC
jgi:hypothetical protein